MALVYSYLRFSSKKQELGDSKRRQLELGREWIARNKHTESNLKLHDLGVSAFRGKNKHTGALKIFIDMCQSGEIDSSSILLVENLDRLSREGADEAFVMFKQILSTGVNIAVLKPDERLYTKESIKDFFSLLMPLMYFHIAYIESKNKSDRLKSVWNNKRDKRKTFNRRRPAWLDYEDDKGFILNEGAKAIQFIFEETANGQGQKQILKSLQNQFVPIGTSGSWNASYIAKVLNDSATYGELQPMEFDHEQGKKVLVGEPIEDYYPAAISQDLWYMAQNEKRKRKPNISKHDPYVNIFKGLVFNANDRHPMHMIRSRTKTDFQRRLVSYGHIRKLENTDSVSVDLSELNRMFLNILLEIQSSDISPNQSKTQKEVSQCESSLLDIVKRMKEIETAMTDISGVPVKTLVASLNKLEEQKKEYKQRLSELISEQQDHADDMLNIAIFLSESPNENDLRQKLNSKMVDVIDKIWIKPEKHFGKVYALVQVFYANNTRMSEFVIGRGVADTSIKGTTAVHYNFNIPNAPKLTTIDLRDANNCKRYLLTELAKCCNEIKPYVLPDKIPTTLNEAIEVWLNIQQAEQKKDSYRMIPPQIKRFQEFTAKNKLTRKSHFKDGIQKKWQKHLTDKVIKGEFSNGSARNAYNRARQFLKWWRVNIEFPTCGFLM
ncbi:recombinase family protein [Gimesia sp.]|uniref:recombinase family protein n=1 Tax=Gimesia sp. TaxID=2024833 RepID=UPI003A95CF8C